MFCRRIVTLAVCLLLATPQLGLAKKETDSQKPIYLEKVTVTANKQEENIQEIPASISALSETQLEDANIYLVEDLAKRVPNLSFFTGGTNLMNFATMRGIRSDPHNNVSAVAMYIDGIPVTSNVGFVTDLFDIERVEVLRGPQGTLYGRSSIGGVINIITKTPDNTWRSKVTAQGGTNDLFRVGGNIAGPIFEDRLFFDISGTVYNQSGTVENEDGGNVDNRRHYTGRGKLRLTPNKDLDITLYGSYLKYDEGSFSMYEYPVVSERKIDTDTPGYNQTAIDGQALNITYNINDDWTVTSISSRRVTDVDFMVDYDLSMFKMFETNNASKYQDLSQELRFNYENEGTSVLFGAYADRYSRVIKTKSPNHPLPSFRYHRVKDVTDTYSLFAHAKYPLLEKLNIIGGLRYDRFNTDFENTCTNFSDKKSWNSLSPKAALEYQLTEENMVYASISHGYRVGGFLTMRMVKGNELFDPEKLWAYEVGSKNTFFDKTLKANIALFLNDIKDAQIEAYEFASGMPTPYVDNAGDMKAYGVELELNWFPVDSLELFGTFGYTYLRFDKFEDITGKHDGNRLPFVPDYTLNAGAQYRHNSGFFARGEVLGSSKTYLDPANKYSIPGHATVNAKIGWEFDQLDVYLFANNLFDQEYDYNGAFGGAYSVASPPRSIGIMFNYNFF